MEPGSGLLYPLIVSPLTHRILDNWRLHCSRPGLRRVLVAVSGGVDSVVLLRSLESLAGDLGLELAAAHFNHRLRGTAADADQAFVRTLADELRIPCFEGAARVRAEATASRESLEMTGRRLRHSFLAATARKWNADGIALAHHADDQAELFLIRLLRGAGGAGLAGMRWRSPSPSDPGVPLVRPLLNLSKTELETEAATEAWPFREDETNRDPSILRNRIRHELLPLLEEGFQPGIRTVLNRTADLVGDEATFVEETAVRWRSARADGGPFCDWNFGNWDTRVDSTSWSSCEPALRRSQPDPGLRSAANPMEESVNCVPGPFHRPTRAAFGSP